MLIDLILLNHYKEIRKIDSWIVRDLPRLHLNLTLAALDQTAVRTQSLKEKVNLVFHRSARLGSTGRM